MNDYRHPPIEDYALIGDCETAALVSRSGSIDWLCWPRFDSESCFSSIIGRPEQGHWKIAPAEEVRRLDRRYIGPTLILETVMETANGEISIIDFMPVRAGEMEESTLVRLVVGRRGVVPMRMDLVIRFDYGRIVPWVRRIGGNCIRAVAGPNAVILTTPVEHRGENLATTSEFEVREGERIPFVLTYEASHLPYPRSVDAEIALRDSEAFWKDWSSRCTYQGDWPEQVMRSLITIKALTYKPTGGIVAAPTTSLPETIGGNRNWDYRFCWLRDATFALLSLINAGYRREAEAWGDWLLRAIAGSTEQVQPVYGLGGEHRLDERELAWLTGYRHSQPVRIGNGAYPQFQIDVFGNVMDVLHEARYFGLDLHEAGWGMECEMLRHLESEWNKPDEGIWEVRNEGQHFVHSKVLAWVAFDRGIKSAERFGFNGPLNRWRNLRDRIHAEICEFGFNERRGAFTQAYGSDALDAANLLIPIVGFLPPSDPRVVSTVKVIEQELTRDGLVLRYDTNESDDGLEGEEGAFLACSFWLVDNMILQGRRDEARELFEHLLSLTNDVGLMAEQYDWDARRLVGNFPQAFSHFALVDTAFNFIGERGSAREADEERQATG